MSIYQNIYDLIVTYVYGGVTLSASMELVTVTLATIGCVFVFALPFVLVWKVCKMFVG